MRIHTGKEDLYTFPPSQTDAFCLELMGTSYCDANYRIHRSNEPVWVFENVLEGTGTLEIDGRSYHPGPGQCYIVPAYSTHTYYADPIDPWRKRWFNVHGPLIADLVAAYGVADVVLVDIPQLIPVFEHAYERCLESPIRAHTIVALAVHEIISIIAGTLPRGEQKRTQALHDYLATHPSEQLSADEMAAIQCLSVSQTIRLFRHEWGCTPYQFHLRCRINAARALLKSTSKTVREISEDLGFPNEYHFSRIFKKKVGSTPGQTRSMQQNP